jgi:hypothetical protein
LFSGEELELSPTGKATIPLDGYGFRWLRVHPADEALQY